MTQNTKDNKKTNQTYLTRLSPILNHQITTPFHHPTPYKKTPQKPKQPNIQQNKP